MNRDLTAFHAQHDAIRAEFAAQAETWGRDEISPDLLWAVDLIDPRPHFEVLDVAAGTGLLSRALAPRVRRVTAVDITAPMMEAGVTAAERQGIGNVRFQAGAAEDLPFPDASFDLVVTRFSIHHFASPSASLREMARVCRFEGRVGIIDIVSPGDEALASRYNHLERLRDPTHVIALSRTDLRAQVEEAGLRVVHDAVQDVPMRLDAWLDRTRTAGAARTEIVDAIRAELAGGEKTGMNPSAGGDGFFFTHVWNTIVAIRNG